MFTVTSERQISRIRREFMSSLLRQDMAWFDKNKTGEINSRLAECVAGVCVLAFPPRFLQFGVRYVQGFAAYGGGYGREAGTDGSLQLAPAVWGLDSWRDCRCWEFDQINALSTFFVGLAIAFWKGWELTLVLFAFVPILGIAALVLMVRTL
jgi:ABC-type multidrug transport system fused ATPase/permease subunit